MFANEDGNQVCSHVSLSNDWNRWIAIARWSKNTVDGMDPRLAHTPCVYLSDTRSLLSFPSLDPSPTPFVPFSRAEPGTSGIDRVLREIYILYTDCALKDPFYELEMPIRCELFTTAVDALIQTVERTSRMR